MFEMYDYEASVSVERFSEGSPTLTVTVRARTLDDLTRKIAAHIAILGADETVKPGSVMRDPSA